MSLPSDSTLDVLDRARAGDALAVEELIERALPGLRRSMRGRLPLHARGPADTEDFIQDAVLQTLKHLETFEHRTVGSLQAYLHEAVLNRIRDEIRRVSRRGTAAKPVEELVADDPSPLELAVKKERSDLYLEALHRLRPDDRQAVILRLERGLPFAAIAERLGVRSADAARMRVNRALGRLTAEMGAKPDAS